MKDPPQDDRPGKLPGYDLKRVFALRNRIVDEAGFGFYEAALTGSDYRDFVAEVASVFKGLGVSFDVLFDSCRDVLGKELDDATLFGLAWRLAGNTARLRGGEAVHPWGTQREPEWVPLEVTGGELGRDRYDRSGSWFEFQTLAGSPCPIKVKKFWSREQCSFFATVLGFTAPWAKAALPYSHPLQIVRTRLYGLFTPELSRDKPVFKEIAAPRTLLDHNVAVLRLRFRHEPCPREYTHPCHGCAIGYLVDQGGCPAAVHPTQWYADYCPGCDKDSQPFDDTMNSGVCVFCTRKRRTAHRKE